MMKYVFGLMVFLYSSFCSSQVLETEHFIVTININCDSEMLCDDVLYIGKSKISDNEIHLKGSTVHTMCSDGVTPCTFKGYLFKNGNIEYFISVFGDLIVTDNKGKTLVEESGELVD